MVQHVEGIQAQLNGDPVRRVEIFRQIGVYVVVIGNADARVDNVWLRTIRGLRDKIEVVVICRRKNIATQIFSHLVRHDRPCVVGQIPFPDAWVSTTDRAWNPRIRALRSLGVVHIVQAAKAPRVAGLIDVERGQLPATDRRIDQPIAAAQKATAATHRKVVDPGESDTVRDVVAIEGAR